jgi:hypothetical protein
VGASDKVGGGLVIGSRGLPSGWTREVSKDRDVSIGLPKGWKSVEISAGSLLDSKTHTASRSQADQKILDQGGVKMIFAGPPQVGQKIGPGGAIIAIHTSSDLDTVVEENRRDIVSSTQDMAISDATVHGDPAKVMTYRKPDKAGVDRDHISYYQMKGDKFYICSFTFPEGTPNEKETAEKIANTMDAR